MSLHDYHEYLLGFWLSATGAVYFGALAVVQYRAGKKWHLFGITTALAIICTIMGAWMLGWL